MVDEYKAEREIRRSYFSFRLVLIYHIKENLGSGCPVVIYFSCKATCPFPFKFADGFYKMCLTLVFVFGLFSYP